MKRIAKIVLSLLMKAKPPHQLIAMILTLVLDLAKSGIMKWEHLLKVARYAHESTGFLLDIAERGQVQADDVAHLLCLKDIALELFTEGETAKAITSEIEELENA